MDLYDTHVEELLEKYEPLIHKTLKNLNIFESDMDYEDFFQELQIHLLEIFSRFKPDTTNEEIRSYKFIAYAQTGLRWKAIQLLEKRDTLVHQVGTISQIDWLNNKYGNEQSNLKTNMYVNEFLNLTKNMLNDKEQILLSYLLDESYTMQEIADKYSVSRVTIYNRKEKIKNKLMCIKDCIKN